MYRYSAKDRADIAKYAGQHGLTSAAGHFSRKFGVRVSKTTVKSIRSAYVSEVRQKRARDEGDVASLPCQKRGRRLLIGNVIDNQVQSYLRRVRDGGGIVTARIAVAAARGILLACDRSKLAEFGGHIQLGSSWAYSLLNRMKFVQRKATTSKSKLPVERFAEVKKQFLNDVVSIVEFMEIPAELILNWDQTGIKIVPSCTWTMDQQGSKRVEIVGVTDKRQITAVFCGSLTGDFLPIQVVYKGKTSRCHPHFKFPDSWHVTHSPRHWSTETTMLAYVSEVIVPYVEAIRASLNESKPALVIMDNFKGQCTQQVDDVLEQNDILVCRLPPNTTDRLQPMDISVNKPAKNFLKRKFEQWYAEEINNQLQDEDVETATLQPIDLGMPIMKELGAKWLVEMADYIAENPQFIVNGFIRSGITPALDRRGLEESSDSQSDESNDYDDEDFSDEDQDSNNEDSNGEDGDSSDAVSNLEDSELEDLGSV